MFQKISQIEQINFARNLAVLLKGGVTINEAIDSLANQARKGTTIHDTLHRIKDRIEKGVSLASAMSQENKLFSSVFVSLVKAGELSGSLSENLDFLASWLERDSRLRKEISGVMLYPKIVLSAVLILGGSLVTFILPKLVPMFTSLKVELPLATKLLLGLAVFSQNYWLYIVLAMLLIWLFLYLLFKAEKVRFSYHKFLVVSPFIKEFVVAYQLALFSQLMATLLKSGIALDEALTTAYLGTSNLYYKRTLGEIIDRVSKGVSLVAIMKDYPALYPVNTISILAVGENSGTLEESFFKISDFWTRDIMDRTKSLPTILEPVLLVVIALSVAFIALSIIMPIYKITGNIK